MPHHTPLIGTIVAGLVMAFFMGALAHRLRMPPIVGYLLAGVIVGPSTPGFVADSKLAAELAEIGVILRREIECAGRTPARYLDIGALVRALRHVVCGQIGNGGEQIIERPGK